MLKRIVLSFVLAAAALTSALAQAPVNLVQSQYPTPTNVVVSTVGQQGSTVYCYWVVAVYTGGKSAPAGPGCTAFANASLSSANYDVVTFSAPSGTISAPTGYDVLRAAGVVNQVPTAGANGYSISATVPTGTSNAAVATAQSGSPVNDQSNTLSSYTVATASTTAYDVFDALSAAYPQVKHYVGGVLTGNDTLRVQSVQGTCTLAAINAGTCVLVAGQTGHTISVVGFTLLWSTATMTTCTDLRISDTTPTTDVVTVLIADTTAGAITTHNGTNTGAGVWATHTTLNAAGFSTPLGSGLGVQLRKTGGSCASGGAPQYSLQYIIQ